MLWLGIFNFFIFSSRKQYGKCRKQLRECRQQFRDAGSNLPVVGFSLLTYGKPNIPLTHHCCGVLQPNYSHFLFPLHTTFFFYFLFCYTFLLPRPTLFFLTKNPPFLCSSSSYLRSLKLYTPTLSLPCHYFAGAGESSSLLFNFLVRQRPNTQQQFFLINYMYHTRVE